MRRFRDTELLYKDVCGRSVRADLHDRRGAAGVGHLQDAHEARGAARVRPRRPRRAPPLRAAARAGAGARAALPALLRGLAAAGPGRPRPARQPAGKIVLIWVLLDSVDFIALVFKVQEMPYFETIIITQGFT